jgi:hypothetical protein
MSPMSAPYSTNSIFLNVAKQIIFGVTLHKVRKPEGKIPLVRTRHRRQDVKMEHRTNNRKVSTGSVWLDGDQCHGVVNMTMNREKFHNGKEFRDQMRDYKLLKENYASWN